ncbi:rhamnulokinase [Thermoactinomyces mirandus]|uniref:Rhamnulokinase n=1 Tax=Thermoactinomyces mirandus TaxID=2756294 RepID=A0A7W1XU82_9BACL|nr:rhamnulokinase [Thermoactinomyces mirandus]MBA4603356.1 rhamnulokinase [Thermoactinomyces mirandus]
MKKTCNLAVDLGASSGRIIAGYTQDGRLHLKEVYRFENRIVHKNNHFCWDIGKLFAEMKKGIHQSREYGFKPVSIGVDSWAVDFVLLDEEDNLLTDAVAYRDQRTDGMMEEVFNIIRKEELYFETGIQFQKFNTIYQLYYLKKHRPDILKKAKTFLMIPDYLHFLLTGKKVNEYTNATTTQLVNANTKKWDKKILDKLEIPSEMFQQIRMPKSCLGKLRPELAEEFGFDMEVILPATHDTGSAVVSVPETDDTIYISSGTWSLIGIETGFPICSAKALDCNFTNEGGLDYRFRFLKNIMGLWMIQEVKRNLNHRYSYADFAKLASMERHFHAIVPVNDDRFLKPENMIEEIRNACLENNQPVPENPGQIAKTVFESLAFSYQQAVEEIEQIFHKRFRKINVIGGGSQNELLNQLIADKTKKEIVAGPVEATAIGNIAVQLIAQGKIGSLDKARKIIRNSFDMNTYTKTE